MKEINIDGNIFDFVVYECENPEEVKLKLLSEDKEDFYDDDGNWIGACYTKRYEILND